MNLIEQHINEIRTLCQKHKVKELYAFGSVLDENRFNEKSDVDLIVKFREDVPVEEYVDLYFSLAESLEEVLKRKVDLMTFKPIRNRFLKESIEASKQIVYAA